MNGLVWIFLGVVSLSVLLRLLARLVQMPWATRILGAVAWLPGAWHSPLADGQPVELLTRDHVRLAGTYLPARGLRRRGVIALAHELNGDRWSALSQIRQLRRHGFDVFVFDFRNHGQSGRTAGYEPTPWASAYELADLRAVIDYLCARPDADRRGIGLLGVGRGGTAALCAAAGDSRVRAVAVDGLIPAQTVQQRATREAIAHGLRSERAARLVPDWFVSLLGAWARRVVSWRCGCQLLDVERTAHRIEQPVLVIQGQQEPYVPMEVVQASRTWLGPTMRLCVMPHARFARPGTSEAAEYQRAVVRFFTRHLSHRMPSVRLLRARVRNMKALVISGGEAGSTATATMRPKRPR